MLNIESYEVDRTSKLPEKNWFPSPKNSYQKYMHGLKRRRPYRTDIDEYHEHTPRLCIAATVESFPQKFKRLLAEWREQAAFLPFVTTMAMLPSYQEIIGMGKPALPLILNELKRRPSQKRKPSHLFWALRAISGEDPVPPENRGRIEQMRRAWIKWGRQNKIIE